jgi:hypothetical protein
MPDWSKRSSAPLIHTDSGTIVGPRSKPYAPPLDIFVL